MLESVKWAGGIEGGGERDAKTDFIYQIAGVVWHTMDRRWCPRGNSENPLASDCVGVTIKSYFLVGLLEFINIVFCFDSHGIFSKKMVLCPPVFLNICSIIKLNTRLRVLSIEMPLFVQIWMKFLMKKGEYYVARTSNNGVFGRKTHLCLTVKDVLLFKQ